MGPWLDADADDILEFSGPDEGDSISASAGQAIQVILKWDDPFGTSCNDYDLYLLNASLTTVLAASEEVQDYCTSGIPSYPVENLAYFVPSAGTYHLAITRFQADGAATFHLYSLGPSCPALQYCAKAGSLLEPADNPNALTVGAVRWSTPSTIENFSSRGPTDDGRTKPDLVAPDGVKNVSFGSFFGTSAASPHAAAAAALVRQWQPGWTATQVRSFLAGQAVDLGAPGTDNTFGSGRLDLGSPKDGAADTDSDTLLNSSDPDDDNDGCTDDRELGASVGQGGLRNPHSFWDFFDVPAGGALTRDAVVSGGDVAAVVGRFGANDSGPGTFDRTSDPLSTPNPVSSNARENYHPAYDRGGPHPELNAWNMLPPDGSISAGDIAGVVIQFGHTCAS
jgi:hypothetical protein